VKQASIISASRIMAYVKIVTIRPMWL